MQLPLQITFRGIAPSDAVVAQVHKKAKKLERFHGRLTSCHVTIEAPPQHQAKGGVFRVNIDLTVPGGEIVASRESGRDHAHDDVYVAIRDAFSAAVRQLEDHARRVRGDVKMHAAALEGHVRRSPGFTRS